MGPLMINMALMPLYMWEMWDVTPVTDGRTDKQWKVEQYSVWAESAIRVKYQWPFMWYHLCSGRHSVQHFWQVRQLCYLCSSVFNCVPLCLSLFIFVHLCSSLFIFVQADIVCNILDKLGRNLEFASSLLHYCAASKVCKIQNSNRKKTTTKW